MADILLSNDDLTVFGGPESISLDLDIGPQGDRGSIIIGVLGDPRNSNVASTIVQDVQALDLAIDYQPASPYFKTVFQLVSTGSGLQWTPLINLKANSYSSIKQVTASNGRLVIPPINVTEIYDLSENEVTSANFKVNYSISGGGPLATSLIVNEIDPTQGFLALPLEIKGVEYDEVEEVWFPMTGPKSVHLFITVV
jgi:hypothetical protein